MFLIVVFVFTLFIGYIFDNIEHFGLEFDDFILN